MMISVLPTTTLRYSPLFALIINNLLVINDLMTTSKHFLSDKTYRKKDTWTSELDTCITSQDLVKCVSDFYVVRQSGFPSDHAPIAEIVSTTGVDLDSMLTRAMSLEDHSALYKNDAKRVLAKKPVKFSNMDRQKSEDKIVLINVALDSTGRKRNRCITLMCSKVRSPCTE